MKRFRSVQRMLAWANGENVRGMRCRERLTFSTVCRQEVVGPGSRVPDPPASHAAQQDSATLTRPSLPPGNERQTTAPALPSECAGRQRRVEAPVGVVDDEAE